MKNAMKKYLIPNKKNDFKPHLLRSSGISLLVVLALGLFAIGIFKNFLFTQTDFLSSVLPPVLVDLANADRTTNAEASLTVNPLLVEVAQEKANDMASKGYFAHDTPDGKSPWYWFSKVGYSYSSAGENLAINFTDSGDVNTAWMNSPEHRANILNGKFTEIGVATAQGMYQGRPTVFVVQEFGKPYIVKNGSALVKATPKKTSSLAKNATSTATTTIVATASTTVLGASETFISVNNPDASPSADVSAAVTNDKQASTMDTLATEPHKVISLGYLILAGIVILALALMIGIELKRQHPKNVFAGLVVLVLIVALLYTYQQMTGSVVVL